eukprot:TRINITY_DN1860_c0_g1_i1.p1 TRINITY_DN1860_c0_g1~~TRINITY_DN1860_c0_g1_i1.p1  ORF type:complete len:776 (-),score=331.18 TRINITY_DN1860_c0_g1_i1:62-2389(-)
MADTEQLVAKFQRVGLTEAKAKETVKNKTVSSNLSQLVDWAGEGTDLTGVRGNLLYHTASKTKPQIWSLAPLLVTYITSDKLDTELRLSAAIEHFLKLPPGTKAEDVDSKKLDEAAGVGVVVTAEEVEQAVEDAIKAVKGEIELARWRFNTGPLMGKVRGQLKWADGKAIKSEFELQLLDLLGPKTDEDLLPPPKVEKKKGEKKKVAKEEKATGDDVEEDGAATISELMKTKVHFHKPGENYTTDGYVTTPTTRDRLREHLERTGGQVRTRFPPEPNGILHIGHAKAININFGYAAAHNGVCNLRYDDTNPEKEEERFFTGILDMVTWLGYTPHKVTHSSDNFQQLFDWAKLLVEKDMAYVCHQQVEDIRGFNPPPSPWRNRPIVESLQLFEDMKNGKFDEGQATLRLKVTLEEGKQDPVAYRIKYVPHHRSGDTWCIYPTYDYTHCLCDSIEDISHSLCTKEFQARRSSYYWLCNAVDIYCPVQWEYGRLNVHYTVVSKRKIAKLIETGVVQDWDDPRLFTLTALRRRGFPSEAINNFCARMGVTGAQATVDPAMLEAVVRDTLNTTAKRSMVVTQPLKVTVVGDLKKKDIKVPDFPNEPEKGDHSVTLESSFYIERSDFREAMEAGYRRLCPGQAVGLRYAGLVIELVDTVKKNGEVVEVKVKTTPIEEAAKPKAFIHWVAAPVPVEVRMYGRLFKHSTPEDPAVVPGGFLEDIAENTLEVRQALADKHLVGSKLYEKFQFERIGFFCVDRDSTKGKLVFNLTVGLKEDAGKL